MTTQSEKNEILVKVKRIQKKIALVTTDLTGMKYVSKKLENYNELLSEGIKHQTKFDETLRHENY